MRTAFAALSVVIPLRAGDHLNPILHQQLVTRLPGAQVHIVCADPANVASLCPLAATAPGLAWSVLLAQPGRASQQNAGAAASTRDWLWFLHADSVLADTTLPALAGFLQRTENALGYFDLRFLADGPALMPLNAAGAWLRSRWLRLPFGDQGLVLQRATFTRLGGFDAALAHGEDHQLLWRARRAGLPLRPLRSPLYTSARKYAEHGWWPTTSHHLRETWRQVRRFSRAEGGR